MLPDQEISAKDVANLDANELAFLDSEHKWLSKARIKQVLPLDGWSLAIARAGRGFGKTETGAQWVRRESCLYPGIVTHAIAPSHADLIGTLFQGISGLLAVTPPDLIESTNFSAAIPVIRFKNGSVVKGFSSQSPDRLRGPQASRVWGDELAAWENAEETLVNVDMSTRIAYRTPAGKLIQPQRLYTTTPKPLKWLADLIKKANIVIEGSTYENKANLAEDFISSLSQYEGTQIGRQEIHGELLDISEAAIIKRSWLKLWPNKSPLPWFDFVMVVLDTAFTEKTFNRKSYESDPTGCQVWGVFSHDRRWNMMLLEHWKDRIGFPELLRRAKKEMRAEYGRRTEQIFKPFIGGALHAEQIKRPDLLMIEDKGSGISLRQMLSQEGIDSWPYNPGKADKLSRLHGVSHIPAAGRIWLPESTKNEGEPRNWIMPMLDELCSYSGPGTTKHDEDVDCFSMACRYFGDRWMSAGVEGLIKPDSQYVNVSIGGVDRMEWLEDDRIPGVTYEEGLSENPYG